MSAKVSYKLLVTNFFDWPIISNSIGKGHANFKIPFHLFFSSLIDVKSRVSQKKCLENYFFSKHSQILTSPSYIIAVSKSFNLFCAPNKIITLCRADVPPPPMLTFCWADTSADWWIFVWRWRYCVVVEICLSIFEQLMVNLARERADAAIFIVKFILDDD